MCTGRVYSTGNYGRRNSMNCTPIDRPWKEVSNSILTPCNECSKWLIDSAASIARPRMFVSCGPTCEPTYHVPYVACYIAPMLRWHELSTGNDSPPFSLSNQKWPFQR